VVLSLFVESEGKCGDSSCAERGGRAGPAGYARCLGVCGRVPFKCLVTARNRAAFGVHKTGQTGAGLLLPSAPPAAAA